MTNLEAILTLVLFLTLQLWWNERTLRKMVDKDRRYWYEMWRKADQRIDRFILQKLDDEDRG